uniref:Protein Vpu n=1 Tax=Human immunodeficiency virus type 1 TaxID=11676 RepID=C5HAY7_HV1|nr:vpu protein [Human immunodeficiency virus 1]
MQPLVIVAIVALVVVTIIAIVVWTIVLIEYRRILRQRRIDRLIDRIRERAEDSGNKSKGNHKKLAGMLDIGHHAPWDVNNL